MDNDVWALFVKVVKIVLVVATIVLSFVGGCASGQDLDGVCRLTVDGKQWSGVAISDHHILTVGHHGEMGAVRAEFPGLRSEVAVVLPARVLRTHKLADLSLIEFDRPDWVKLRTYPVKRKPIKRVKIKGYTMSIQRELEVDLLRGDTVVDGFVVNTFRGKAHNGMSGSGVFADGETVGIQFGGDEKSIDAVTPETIEIFLRE